VRPASLFLLGQSRFSIFVGDMWRGSLLCASDLYLWCGVGFRMICSVHGLHLLYMAIKRAHMPARQLFDLVRFVFPECWQKARLEARKAQFMRPAMAFHSASNLFHTGP
jgi:hypothetical protein